MFYIGLCVGIYVTMCALFAVDLVIENTSR
jgi:hypothetical protein